VRRSKAFEKDYEDDLDDDLDDDLESEDGFPDDDLLDDEDSEDEDDDELSGLLGEELKMVEEGVSGKVLTSEQAKEVAGMLREELSIHPDDHAIRLNEFLCESCFLVKRVTQRASGRSKICKDCY